MEETQRQNLVMSFSNVLRTSALVGVVDLQRAALAFSALLERTPDGQPLALEPLYDFLLEQNAPEGPVREVMVFIKSREERFGLKMELPPRLAALSEEERAKLVAAFTQRGASTGTQSGKQVDPSKANRRPGDVEEALPQKDDFGRERSPGSRVKILGVVAGFLVFAGIVEVVVVKATAPQPPVVLSLTDPAGLPCVEAKGSNRSVICRVTKAFADSTPKPVVDAKGAVTAAAARSLGYNRVMVFSIEDSHLRWVF